MNVFEIPKIITKEELPKINEKENINLETIDEKIMTIDDFLDNFDK